MLPILIGIVALFAGCATAKSASRSAEEESSRTKEEEFKGSKPQWKNDSTFTVEGPCSYSLSHSITKTRQHARVIATQWWLKNTSDGQKCTSGQVSAEIISNLVGSPKRCSDDRQFSQIVEVNLQGAKFMCLK